ncbi:glycosyl transferase [Sulfuricella sp. T08]|uniref:glycosyltransferase family 2 protein n=1 Tax=Sulfuricella sp. T08 TaxID=1632857 RepID=UPI0006179EA6|nr:glycosyltransferase family 2 protein [Sulfuricella sp. T08]GAO37039.1 glycosyl transferase [Sulfuricella sp. T08]
MTDTISIILPAKNEAASLRALLPKIQAQMPGAEIIVVNDGSTDDTAEICRQYGAKLVTHPYGMGNGAAVKSGARAAQGEILIFMDADGQHQPQDIPLFLEKLSQGYDMAVGARSRRSQAGVHRAAANGFYNRLASWMVGQKVADLTSGFRAVRADKFRKFLYMLPNGFSYPTTITMSFFRAGFAVGYVPIHTPKRIGTSHMRIARDGVRFLLIIFKIGSLYSPLKLFFPISVAFFLLGCGNYLHTYLTLHRFTNMSAMLLITAMVVFLIGLVSEQITMLAYRDSEH